MKKFFFVSVFVLSTAAFAVGEYHGSYGTQAYGSRPNQDAEIQSLLTQASACGLERPFVPTALGATPPAQTPQAYAQTPNYVPPVANAIPGSLAPPVSALPSATPLPSPTPSPTPKAEATPSPSPEPSPEPTPEPAAREEEPTVPRSAEKVAARERSADVDVDDADVPKPSVPKPSDHPEAQAHWLSAPGFARRAVWAFPSKNKPGFHDYWDTDLKAWTCT